MGRAGSVLQNGIKRAQEIAGNLAFSWALLFLMKTKLM
jgi:hypothetical protein